MRDSFETSLPSHQYPFDFVHHHMEGDLAKRHRKQSVDMEVEHAGDQPRPDQQHRPDDPSNSSPSSPFTFNFPPTHTTPTRRRQQPPPAIPNFPSAHEHRNPQPATPFSLSPIQSPAPRSPFRSPDPPTPLQQPNMSRRTSATSLISPQPFSFPTQGASSPWLALAASSGAPTPSLEGGPMGRSSPHLGYPFERLNIGGSWSGANLWGGEAAPARRDSSDSSPAMGSSPTHTSTAALSPPSISGASGSFATGGGLNAETIARYQAMAGKVTSPPLNKTTAPDRGGIDLQKTASLMNPAGDSSTPSLPALLAKRRASLPKNTLPVPGSHAIKSPSPLASSTSSVSPPPTNKLQPITPQHLSPLVPLPSTLILDLRPPSSFQASHIPRSHSLPIPSTLLRRPAFTLDKLAKMLAPSSQEAVGRWKEKRDIVLIDVDSGSIPAGGAMDGLAAKFEREGFTGHVWFVKGGHSALVKTGQTPLTTGDQEPESISSSIPNAPSGLMARRLGNLAFQAASTGSGQSSKQKTTGMQMQIPSTPSFDFRSNPFGISMPNSNSGGTARPAGLTLQKDAAFLAGPSSGNKTAKFQPANPFFDNIRQNLELSHGGITERIALNLSDEVVHRAGELPDFLRDLVMMPDKESMDVLAKQFYDLELCEQKRLQSVMDWHSKGSGAALGQQAGRETPSQMRERDKEEVDRLADWAGAVAKDQDDYYPFSITAGVERGTKNRYKNIWPYDFSRVRLENPPDEDSDYINASFVQPRGTNRRYIATQGPLDATFTDFWTLVWEQDVRVIVMITKQYEGGLMKCGNYWQDQIYGGIRLHLVSQSGGDDQAPQATTGFDFGPVAVTPTAPTFPHKEEVNIKRIFELTRLDQPDEKSRRITQIQCIGWPDFDVPESPDILFNLIKEVDAAVETTPSGGVEGRKNQPPILVHCSAGVGRTGSFITVDAVLDGLLREHHEHQAENAKTASYDSLDSKGALPRPIIRRTISTDSDRSSALGPNRSLLGLQSGSLTSGSGEGLSTMFSSSPVSFATASTSASDLNLPLSSSNMATLNRVQEETMEVDSKMEEEADVPSSPPVDAFKRHRGSIAASTSSDVSGSGTRRPSVVSFTASSEYFPVTRASTDKNAPAPMQKLSSDTHPPSPLSSMTDPVATVLHGMRVQRMSLVQTLRQYLFVYRAIITSYLKMIDEEETTSSRSRPSTLSTTGASSSSIGTMSTTDDEGHIKRRASPTELRPEHPSHAIVIGSGASSLSKRPSFKKMRQGLALDGLQLAHEGGNGASSPKRRSRRGSKLTINEKEKEKEKEVDGEV